MNGGGGNYSPGGGGGTSNNRGQNFGGNPGQRNSLDYMRALNEAQYGGGVEYLQSPLGRHLAMQQEIELRRRQVEEQHLISELEYQNQLRRLQHQQQMQGQFGSMYGQPFQLSAISDDFLLQQQQQMLLQDQIAQQQMHAHMSQQRDREELLSMLHRRTDQNLQMPQIPPSNSLMVEPLPAARQSAEPIDTEMRYESEEPASASELFSSTAAKERGKPSPPKKSTPAKRDPSPAKASSPRKKNPSPAKGKKSFPKEKPSRNGEHKSQESKKPVANGGKASKIKMISYIDLLAAEPVDLTAKGTKDVEEGSQSTEKEEPNLRAVTKSLPKRDKKGSTTKTSITKTAKELVAKTNKKDSASKTASKDDEADVHKAAADIVVNFAQVNMTPDEIQMATKWSKQSHASTTTYQEISLEETPFISARMKFNIPSLPLEPESTGDSDLEVEVQMEDAVENTVPEKPKKIEKENSSLTGPEYVLLKPNIKFAPRENERDQDQDEWWPSNQKIRQERRKRGLPFNDEDTDEEIDPKESQQVISFNKGGLNSIKKRMKTSVEPGVLEKLPHCKLYEDYCTDEKKYTYSPKFCCQTTETFPYKAMVCCSICSTWRHAQCGGHYKRYSSDSTDPSNMLFVPVCDICYLEKPYVEGEGDTANAKRLDRQRVEHLRSCNATNAVMRQYAFSKHAGPYKWPLGNVCVTHSSGHTKSVAGRHEKSEKQWADMVERIGKTDMKARERLRVRTREFERIMISVEDAEGVTDRHNMTLFLRNDVRKPNPAGFENPRRNIFDPEDDLIGMVNPEVSDSNGTASASSLNSTSTPSSGGMDAVTLGRNGLGTRAGRKPALTNKEGNTDDKADLTCRRQGCCQKPRFDSIFCSDACGVSTVEADLLQTLEYAGDMHPTSLR
eukprot:scaffold7350_cov176-Skeletonema_marinoi.AAC.2